MNWLDYFNKNKYLSKSESKDSKLEILCSIDDKIVDSWAEEKTMGDFLCSLNQKELELFNSLKIIDTGKYGDDQLDISIAIPNQKEEWYQVFLN